MSDNILVQMPDGSLVEAPANVTRGEIEERYNKMLRLEKLKASNPGEYDPTSKEYQAKYGATSGMSGWDKAWANVGAGTTNLGVGLNQLFTVDDEKERQIEADIAERQQRNAELARNTRGGKALQFAGDVLPTLALPAGTVARGIAAIPKVGAMAKSIGIGSRAMPTLMAEGAITGTALGAISPTGEDDNPYAQALLGGVGGAVAPALGSALGALYRKYFPQTILKVPTGSGKLGERQIARQFAEKVGQSGADAERKLAQHYNRVLKPGLDVPPKTTAMVTQNPVLGEMELVSRATPTESPAWGQFDEVVDNARWDVLDKALGSAQTVDDAIAATGKFADENVAKYFSKIKPKKFAQAIDDFETALAQKFQSPKLLATPAARAVYGHLAETQRELARVGGWTPEAMWAERQTLSGWLGGRPPVGYEKVRAPKLDMYIMQARNGIDATLNRASGNAWTPFLNEFGERLSVEGQQKAGQNIRNTFVDEMLGVPRKSATAAGKPKVTEHALRSSFSRHGKNRFGRALDSDQEDAVRVVLDNLQSEGVLHRAKATMTGRGGPTTAPMLLRAGEQKAGGDVAELLRWLAAGNNERNQELISKALISPEFALKILRSGRYQLSPLTQKQLMAIAAGTRVALPLEREGLEEFLDGRSQEQ